MAYLVFDMSYHDNPRTETGFYKPSKSNTTPKLILEIGKTYKFKEELVEQNDISEELIAILEHLASLVEESYDGEYREKTYYLTDDYFGLQIHDGRDKGNRRNDIYLAIGPNEYLNNETYTFTADETLNVDLQELAPLFESEVE